MKNTKRLLMLTIALIMTLALAACGGDTAPSNGDTAPTNTPATNTPPSDSTPMPTSSSDNDPAQTQEADSRKNLPLTLQIIDSRNGIFCLYDPNIKDAYTIPNLDIPDHDEIYQWSCGFTVGDDSFSMRLSIQNSRHDAAVKNIPLSQANIITDVWSGETYISDAFSAQVQVIGTRIYFRFSIPDSYDVDLYTVESFGYGIIDNPNESRIKNFVYANDILVSDIETGAVGGTAQTTPGTTTPTTPDISPASGDNNYFAGIDDSLIPDILKITVATLGSASYSDFSQMEGHAALFLTFTNATEADYEELVSHFGATKGTNARFARADFDWGNVQLDWYANGNEVRVTAYIKTD